MNKLSFRQFLEIKEIESSYTNALQDELGVDPEELEKFPASFANAKFGDLATNLGIIDIISFTRKNGEITGAKVKIKDTDDLYLNKDDKMIKVPSSKEDELEGKETWIPIDKLNDLMTQGMEMAGGESGAGSLPGMGM